MEERSVILAFYVSHCVLTNVVSQRKNYLLQLDKQFFNLTIQHYAVASLLEYCCLFATASRF